MEIIRKPWKWQQIMREYRRNGDSIGLVPTMGALHAGHRSLLQRAREENQIAAASIFVNPSQFDNREDLTRYPVTLDDDISMLEKAGIDLLFAPQVESMYPDNYIYMVKEKDLSGKFCGKYRPGHFEGVLTIVLKLLLISHASRMYMGEKDWQQYVLVKRMAEAFLVDTEVLSCPTVREPSGLALSSRNGRLTSDELEKAPLLHQLLSSDRTIEAIKEELETVGFRVEYVEIFDDPELGSRLLAAAYLGKVRLIDNVKRTQGSL
jgi:pantoate--beta-alanine ligase